MTDRPTFATQLERYVDARELAALMGVSPTTIKRFVGAGMPSETWGLSRTRRFLPSEAIAWATDPASSMGHRRDREGNAPGQRQPTKE